MSEPRRSWNRWPSRVWRSTRPTVSPNGDTTFARSTGSSRLPAVVSPQAVCLALTATATPRVQEDIQASLGLQSGDRFLAGFDRPNLHLEVRPKSEPTRQLVEFLRRFPDQSGIVYCATRRRVDELSSQLQSLKLSTLPYHAGLSDEQRRRNQEKFIADDVQIMVATIAFGMGINKPNIRFIVHYDLPKNVESYYQQIGRAGRDGLNAHCLLLFGYGDIRTIKYFIKQKSDEEQRVANLHLNAMIGYAEALGCRRIPLLAYFGEEYPETACGMCDNCLTADRELDNLTLGAKKFLSCVKRTGEIFGAGHVIDVLRGSQSQKVLERRHHELSTYGIGMEYSKRQWFSLSRQCIQAGLLVQELDHGSLKLTSKAWELFRGERELLGRIEAERKVRQEELISDLKYDTDLFALLRQKRKALADRAGLPPYIIFPDTTLVAMAAHTPRTPEELLTMPGVGRVKLEKYGEEFLAVIAGAAGNPAG